MVQKRKIMILYNNDKILLPLTKRDPLDLLSNLEKIKGELLVPKESSSPFPELCPSSSLPPTPFSFCVTDTSEKK